MRTRQHVSHLIALVTLSILIGHARPAAAIPAFARKYQASCAVCHGPAYPMLNPTGRRFKENGYQWEEPAETEYRTSANLRPDPEEPLIVLGEAPLALRASGRATVMPGAATDSAATSTVAPIGSLVLLAGASVFPHVSFFASTTLAPTLAVHHASVGFHNLTGGPALNLRVGRLLLFDFQRPEHRLVTALGNPTATIAVGKNPITLDSAQNGVEVFGRVLGARVFYHLMATKLSDATARAGGLDDHQQLFGELQFQPLPLLTFGVFATRGHTQIADDTRGLTVRFTDELRAEGAFAALEAGIFDLFAQGFYLRHENATGTGEHLDAWAFRVEADTMLGQRWFAIARYDHLSSHHLAPVRMAAVHVGARVLTNLRLAAESAVPLRAIEETQLSLLLDIAF